MQFGQYEGGNRLVSEVGRQLPVQVQREGILRVLDFFVGYCPLYERRIARLDKVVVGFQNPPKLLEHVLV